MEMANRELFLCGSNLRLTIATLASRLGKQQFTGHAYEGQTLSQQVRAETAEIKSGIPHRKQQPPRKASRPRR